MKSFDTLYAIKLALVTDPIFGQYNVVMRSDTLKQYVSLHEALVREKTQLQARLSQIERALGGSSNVVSAAPAAAASAAPTRLAARRGRPPRAAAAPAAAPTPSKAKAGRGRGRGGAPGGKSLKDMALDVVKARPSTRQEILATIQKSGYKFRSTDPLNSLSAMLYSNKKVFKNKDGKFFPA